MLLVYIHDLSKAWISIHALSIPCDDMPKTKILNIRIDAELKKKAKKVAEDDGRTLSNWVTRLIEREVKKSKKD